MMIRPGEPRDEDSLIRLRSALWPEERPEDGRVAARALLAGQPTGLLPSVVFVAESDGKVVGFAEVSLRSFVDGCAPDRPVGYLEGWYVTPECRSGGIGRALVAAAEKWCREQGCREMGSDTWLDNAASQDAHAALGFTVVDRCVHYRKSLDPAPEDEEGAHYGATLAALHHAHFGSLARDASTELLERLAAAGFDRGLVIDLASGSGISSRRMVDAGFTAFGVDLSPDMLRIARALVPEATFVQGSLWSTPLPGEAGSAVAVMAVGEAFSYATDPEASLAALGQRLAAIHHILRPGGLLLFDIAAPGRGGPTGHRERTFCHDGTLLLMEEREERDQGRLTREITVLTPLGRLYRRGAETHHLTLYAPASVEGLLQATGFQWERLTGYGKTGFLPGWHGFMARKVG